MARDYQPGDVIRWRFNYWLFGERESRWRDITTSWTRSIGALELQAKRELARLHGVPVKSLRITCPDGNGPRTSPMGYSALKEQFR